MNPSDSRRTPIPALCAGIAVAMIPLNIGICWWAFSSDFRRVPDAWFAAFTLVASVQFATGAAAVVTTVLARRRDGRIVSAIVGGCAALGAPVGWFLGALMVGLSAGGGAWGRPLRIRGRQLHPELKEGSDWTRGRRPSPEGLDPATREALAALWLHDAQKEHASVPAFSRLSWILAAVGAPAELLAWSHRAALEEIEHTQLCFALAAGYAGRSKTVEPMPELLVGLTLEGKPLHVLAVESLGDGCQLEDFNADVAQACATVCDEPVTRAVLEQIAREERTHADFSWAVLSWLLERDPAHVTAALEESLRTLQAYPRPTAVSGDKRALVEKADANALLRHGRLPDARWGELWKLRLGQTRTRVRALLDRAQRPAA